MINKLTTPVVALLLVNIILVTYILFHWNDSRNVDENTSCKDQSSTIIDVAPVTLNSLSEHYKVRAKFKYTGKILFDKLSQADLEMQSKKPNPPPTNDQLICERWAVVTSVYHPTPAVQKQALIHGWCLLVVADSASPEEYNLDEIPHHNFVYLSLHKQHELAHKIPFLHTLQWNHVGRKNAGYLYAMLHGARLIWDFEDDVMVLSKHHTFAPPGEDPKALDDGDGDSATAAGTAGTTTTTTTAKTMPQARLSSIPSDAVFEARVPAQPYRAEVLNPFPLFDATHSPSWPRGFPPDRILSNSSTHDQPIATVAVQVPASSIGVVQYFANHDPDVDSMYRLVRPLPLDFPLQGHAPLLLPAFTDYNDDDSSSSSSGGSGSGEGALRRRRRAAAAGADEFAALSPDEAAAHASAPTATATSTTATSSQDSFAAAPSTPAQAQQQQQVEQVDATALARLPPPGVGTVYAPYNAQATLHMYASLWAIMLPLSVNGRVSDIWRSYIAQRLFPEIGIRVAFHSPVVTHFRRPRSYLKDLFQELPLFADSMELVRLLRAWEGRHGRIATSSALVKKTATLPGRLEELYIYLCEEGFVEQSDVQLVQAWIQALMDAGYVFPPLIH